MTESSDSKTSQSNSSSDNVVSSSDINMLVSLGTMYKGKPISQFVSKTSSAVTSLTNDLDDSYVDDPTSGYLLTFKNPHEAGENRLFDLIIDQILPSCDVNSLSGHDASKKVVDPGNPHAPSTSYDMGTSISELSNDPSFAGTRRFKLRTEIRALVDASITGIDLDRQRIRGLPNTDISNNYTPFNVYSTFFEQRALSVLNYINRYINHNQMTIDDANVVYQTFNQQHMTMTRPQVESQLTHALMPGSRGFASLFISANSIYMRETVGVAVPLHNNVAGGAVGFTYKPGDRQIRRWFRDFCYSIARTIAKSQGTSKDKKFAEALSLSKAQVTVVQSSVTSANEQAALSTIHGMVTAYMSGGAHFITYPYVADASASVIIDYLCAKMMIPDFLLTDETIANIDNTLLKSFILLILKTITVNGPINNDRVAWINYITKLRPENTKGVNFLMDAIGNPTPGLPILAGGALGVGNLPVGWTVANALPPGIVLPGTFLANAMLGPNVPVGNQFTGFNATDLTNLMYFLFSDRSRGRGWANADVETIHVSPIKHTTGSTRLSAYNLSRTTLAHGGNFCLLDTLNNSDGLGVGLSMKTYAEYMPLQVLPGLGAQRRISRAAVGAAIGAVFDRPNPLPAGRRQQLSAFLGVVASLQGINSLPPMKNDKLVIQAIISLLTITADNVVNTFESFIEGINVILKYVSLSTLFSCGVRRNHVSSVSVSDWFVANKHDEITMAQSGCASILSLVNDSPLGGVTIPVSADFIFKDSFALDEALHSFCSYMYLVSCCMFTPSLPLGGVVGIPVAPAGTMPSVLNVNFLPNVKFSSSYRFTKALELYNRLGFKHSFVNNTLKEILTASTPEAINHMLFPIPSYPIIANDRHYINTHDRDNAGVNAFLDAMGQTPGAAPAAAVFLRLSDTRVFPNNIVKIALMQMLVSVARVEPYAFGKCTSGFIISNQTNRRLRSNAIIDPRGLPVPNFIMAATTGSALGIAVRNTFSYPEMVILNRNAVGNINAWKLNTNRALAAGEDIHVNTTIGYTFKKVSVKEYDTVTSEFYTQPFTFTADNPLIDRRVAIEMGSLTVRLLFNGEVNTLNQDPTNVITEPTFLLATRFTHRNDYPLALSIFSGLDGADLIKNLGQDAWKPTVMPQ